MADTSATVGSHTRLSKSTMFFYSLPQMPVMMGFLPFALILPAFYSGELGLDLALYSNILLIVSLFDVFTDALIGRVSDKTRSRFGRRRIWMVIGIPLMIFGTYKLYLPSGPIDGWYFFIWAMVMRFGWTLLTIPYWSWGAELSPDYQERSRITGSRAASGLIGTLLIWAVLLVGLFGFDMGGTTASVNLIGIVIIIALPITVGLAVWRVPERQDISPTTIPIWEGVKLMWQNGPLKRLILAFLVGYTSFAITFQLYIFYVTSILQAGSAWIWLLSMTTFIGVLAVPVWVTISKRTGKHRAWGAALIISAIVGPLYLLLGPGDVLYAIPILIVLAFASGTFDAMPNSMKADVIDLDTVMTGEDRAALYFSAWAFTQKLAQTIAGYLTLQGLALAGFVPALGPNNDPDGLLALKLIFAVVPSVFFIAAAAIAWNYPITEKRQQELRAEVESRKALQAAAAPAE
ncbi:MAG: MFS transporter [Alphaproteobacteria bacterium]